MAVSGFALLGVLAVLATLLGGAVMIAFMIQIKKSVSTMDLLILTWLLFDAEVRVCLSGTYLVMLLSMTNVKSINPGLAFLWRVIDNVDDKWMDAHPIVVAIQIVTFAIAPMCLLTILGIVTRSYYRHFFQLMLSFSELYSVWILFSTEWLYRGRNLHFNSNLLHIWIPLIVCYCMWVVFPLLLLTNSWVNMKEAFNLREFQRMRRSIQTSCSSLSKIKSSTTGINRMGSTGRMKSKSTIMS